MDVLDPREVMAHGNKVPNGPSSEQLERLFEQVFTRYPKSLRDRIRDRFRRRMKVGCRSPR